MFKTDNAGGWSVIKNVQAEIPLVKLVKLRKVSECRNNYWHFRTKLYFLLKRM